MTEILTLPAAELARRVRSGELSAVQVAETSLAVARAKAELGAFLHLADDAVLASARDIDARRGRGEPLGALAGVPADAFRAAQAARTVTDLAMRDVMLLGFMCWSSIVIVGVEAPN